MAKDEWNIDLEESMQIVVKLVRLSSELKPESDENHYFFEVVRELVDADLAYYEHLEAAYIENDYPRLAWACRGLLELLVILKWALNSGKNANRFAEDRLIDGQHIIEDLIVLERIAGSKDTSFLESELKKMQTQAAKEGVKGNRYLKISELAKEVGMKEEHRSMNRLSSKLVHPTGWSVIAENKRTNSFPSARSILYGLGFSYLVTAYIETRDFNKRQGLRPNP